MSQTKAQLVGGVGISTVGDLSVYGNLEVGTGVTIAAPSSDTFTVSTNGSERIRVDSSGRLAVGTTSPISELHIEKATQAHISVKTTSSNMAKFGSKGNDVYIAGTAGATNVIFKRNVTSTDHPADSGIETARIDSSGRLLVGTSTARNIGVQRLFQIEGTDSTNPGAHITLNSSAAASAAAAFVIARTRGTAVGSQTAVENNDILGYLAFAGANGTDTSNYAGWITCEVDGVPFSSGDTTDLPGRLAFYTTADGASSPTEALRITRDQDLMISQSGSGLFVGTTADGAYRIGRSSYAVSSGTLYIGNAAIQVSSDVRLKKDIEDTNLDALAAISKIKVKDFTWDDPTDTSYNNRNARGKWTGLIAQELIEVLPFVVNAPRKEEDGSIDHDSESVWTLDQSQLCPVMIKAIQQQQEIIANLEARLSALEAQ